MTSRFQFQSYNYSRSTSRSTSFFFLDIKKKFKTTPRFNQALLSSYLPGIDIDMILDTW